MLSMHFHFSHPATYRFFLYPFYAMHCRSTLSLTEHGHTVDTVFFRMAKSGKERPFCPGTRLLAYFTYITLDTLIHLIILYHMPYLYFLIFFIYLIYTIYSYLLELHLTHHLFPFLKPFPFL
jgi:hypothetical protein